MAMAIMYLATLPTSSYRLEVSLFPKLVLILPTIYDIDGRRRPAKTELNAPKESRIFSLRVL